MKNYNNLKTEIIDQELCCFCGTCAGLCPTRAIYTENEKIRFHPFSCISCGKCISVCPGADFDFPAFQANLFPGVKQSRRIGSHQTILKGFSTDQSIREKASSGGCVTAIALYLLQNRIVDGVIGVRQKKENPSCSTANILRTENEIREASQSKYTLVAVNEVLRQVLDTEGVYLYIGLPCQVQGLRKAMEKDSILRSRIYMCISIFCGFNMRHEATDFLIRKSGISAPEIQSVQYRGKSKGQTGFLIKGKESDFFISKHGYTWMNVCFSPERCWKCYDLTGEFADVSFGDAWEMPGGWSRIILRSENAEALIRRMCDEHKLEVKASSEEEILISQKKIINYKKEQISARRKVFAAFPDYHIEYPQQSVPKTSKALFFTLCLWIGSRPMTHRILQMIPIHWMETLSTMLRGDNSNRLSELIRYIFWGIITVLTNLVSFGVLRGWGIEYRIANLIAILLTKTVAFLSNKTFVFRSRNANARETVEELLRFIAARGLTAVVEYFGLIIWVDGMHLSEMPGKVSLLVITTALNYILGKTYVFKKQGSEKST